MHEGRGRSDVMEYMASVILQCPASFDIIERAVKVDTGEGLVSKHENLD